MATRRGAPVSMATRRGAPVSMATRPGSSGAAPHSWDRLPQIQERERTLCLCLFLSADGRNVAFT